MYRLTVRRPRECSDSFFNKPICPCEKIPPEPQTEYYVPRPWVTFTGDEDQSIYEISAKMAALEVAEGAAQKRAKKEVEQVDDEPSSAESDDSFGEEVVSDDDDFTESESEYETAEASASLVAIPAEEVATEVI